jgi:DNA repair protein SbcD/Mre11
LSQARASLPESMCSLVLAHAFVAGSQVSDSERELTVGTAGMVSADIFAGFDYVALGHLHSPQAVGGADHLRYSGSPLAYSFSENDAKSVCLVELSDQGFVAVEAVPIPVGRRVQTVSGLIADLEEGPRSELWTRIELTDARTVLDAQRRLRERFPFVVEISRPLAGTASSEEALSVAKLRALEPAKLADEFWLDVTGSNMSHDERSLMSNALTPSHETVP